MKKIIFMLMFILLLSGTVFGARVTQKQLEFIDEFGDKIDHTTLTSVTIIDAGTTDTSTIYSDRAGTTSMTNPIVTGLAADQITFFSKDADYKCTATDGTYTRTVDNLTGSDTRFAFPTYLVAMSSRTASDSQTYIWGSDSDVTSQWINASDIMRWTPGSDGIAFDIGVSGTGANWDFNVYTGTSLGLMINEGTSVLTIAGLTTNINAETNFATNINSGASTGAVTIGSGTSGAWALDGDTTGTLNADDSIAITVSAGTIDIDSTGGDLGLDATDKSILIDAGEAAADAITITATGTAGGIDITSLGDIDITTTGTATEDITIDNAGGSVIISASEDIADGIYLHSSTGGIDITADGAAAKDLDLVCTNGSTNISAGEDIATAIVLSASTGGIDITADGAAAKDLDLTCTNGSINLTAGESVATSIVLSSSIGGIDITAAGAAAGEDIDITASGSSVNITSTESGVADGIVITASNESLIDVKGPVNLNSTYCLFEDTPIYAKNTTYGGACTGTAGDENSMMFPGATFLYHIIGTQTILGPTMAAGGLDIAMDLAADEGSEITPSILGRGATGGNKQSFIIDTDAFYMKVKIYVTDVSGTDDMLVGFRKVEAFQAAVGTYTDYAALKLQSGDIYIESDLNGGAAATDDTNDNWGDTTAVTLGIFVDVTGAVTYTIDGSAPSATQAFTFDTTDVVTPFIYFIHDTDLAEATYLQSWECGLQY